MLDFGFISANEVAITRRLQLYLDNFSVAIEIQDSANRLPNADLLQVWDISEHRSWDAGLPLSEIGLQQLSAKRAERHSRLRFGGPTSTSTSVNDRCVNMEQLGAEVVRTVCGGFPNHLDEE